MIRSPYATRLTQFGVLNMDNRKPFTNKRGEYTTHKPTTFNPSKSEMRHYDNYVAACN